MKTQAYFNHIQQEILTRLATARHSVIVAVAWLTDPIIFSTLCEKAAEGIQVQLLVLNDEINRGKSSINFEELTRLGGHVYFADIKMDGGIMHHKFCVIDSNCS